MPHQCTDCERTFADGSKEMLSGCPDCGGNKFQYAPGGFENAPTETAPEPPEPPEPAVESTVARTVGNAATAVRDLVGSDAPPEPAFESGASHEQSGGDTFVASDRTGETVTETTTASPQSGVAEPAPEHESEPGTGPEDAAQASARSDVVAPEDLPPAPERTTTRSRPAPVMDDSAEEEVTDRPDLSQLREELNEQFESIRVLEPGQYELNLMELFDREEYIIALQEDGKYTIQVPERWQE